MPFTKTSVITYRKASGCACTTVKRALKTQTHLNVRKYALENFRRLIATSLKCGLSYVLNNVRYTTDRNSIRESVHKTRLSTPLVIYVNIRKCIAHLWHLARLRRRARGHIVRTRIRAYQRTRNKKFTTVSFNLPDSRRPSNVIGYGCLPVNPRRSYAGVGGPFDAQNSLFYNIVSSSFWKRSRALCTIRAK